MTAATARPANPRPVPTFVQLLLTAISAFACFCAFRTVTFSMTYDQPCGNALIALWIVMLPVGAVALLVAGFDIRRLIRADTEPCWWARARLLLGALTPVAILVRLSLISG